MNGALTTGMNFCNIMSNKLKVNTRNRLSMADKFLKKPPGKLELCDLSSASFIPGGMTRAYRNNRYTVMIFDNQPTTHGFAIKVMIQNHHNTPISGHWKEMYAIKNEIFGEETVAVEYYPKVSELLDTHNIYWLFIYPEGVLPVPMR